MKNYADMYLDDEFDEDVADFEKFGRRGKLEPKEGQRPRRNFTQEDIKAKRRKKEAEKERAVYLEERTREDF
jgi:hypothetical protein